MAKPSLALNGMIQCYVYFDLIEHSFVALLRHPQSELKAHFEFDANFNFTYTLKHAHIKQEKSATRAKTSNSKADAFVISSLLFRALCPVLNATCKYHQERNMRREEAKEVRSPEPCFILEEACVHKFTKL